MTGFPFTELSVELAYEIIRFAALPDWYETQSPRYATAVALCSVSRSVRRAAMPHLLHTVSLTSASQVLAFVDSVQLQHNHRQSVSPLSLDYSKHVKRFWCRECWEPLVDLSPNLPSINYRLLNEIMRNLDSLGLDFNCLHLLYNALASWGIDPRLHWRCRKITLTGELWRWRPLTMTPEGSTFLATITHLVLWIPSETPRWIEMPKGATEDELGICIPEWVQHVPFSSFSSLKHIAFPLAYRPTFHARPGFAFCKTIRMLVYTAPQSANHDANIFREWALSHDPAAHGVIVNIPVERKTTMEGGSKADWEAAYLRGLGDELWNRADRLRNGP
jgi:hypothetical protein